jgi:hypothetical protein
VEIYERTGKEVNWPSNLNQEIKMPATNLGLKVELHQHYLRNDGKVVQIIKKHPAEYKDVHGIDAITNLTNEGDDNYYYADDGKAYTRGTEYETFLVAHITFTPLQTTTLEQLDAAMLKLSPGK